MKLPNSTWAKLAVVSGIFIVSWALNGLIDGFFRLIFGDTVSWLALAANELIAWALAFIIAASMIKAFPKPWMAFGAVILAGVIGQGAIPSAFYYGSMEKFQFTVASAPVASGDAFRADLQDVETGEVFEVVARDDVRFPFVWNLNSGTVQAQIRVGHQSGETLTGWRVGKRWEALSLYPNVVEVK